MLTLTRLPPIQSSLDRPLSRRLPPCKISYTEASRIRQRAPVLPPQLDLLSRDILNLIYAQLDYRSLISLSATNRHFHRDIDPQAMADPADKFQFVMRAARDFPQHRPREKGSDHHPGNFECYICYRVRGPEYFDIFQPQSIFVDEHGRRVLWHEDAEDPYPRPYQEIMLRRFCIECGVKSGLHLPMDSLATRLGREMWVCNCRQVWSKPICLRCPDCGGDCPLRPRRRS